MSFHSAEREALKSKHKQHRVGAVIVKGGRILSTGFNKIRPSKELKTETIHAEEDAVLKVLRNGNHQALVGAKIYVTRFTRGGRIGLSKPCERCMALLTSVGMRSASFTTDYGTVETIKC